MATKPDWAFQNERTLAVGPSGCGKTTLALSLLAEFMARRCHVFAFDQKGELCQRLGVPAAHSGADIRERFKAGVPVVYNPHREFPGDTAAGFLFFSGVAWHVARVIPGEVVFVVDEVQDFTGPSRSEIPRPLASIVESGRGWKLHTIAIAQGANLVNARLRQQFKRVAAFCQSESTAVGPLAAWGFDPDAVAALPPGRFILRNRETGVDRLGAITWKSGQAAVRLSPGPR